MNKSFISFIIAILSLLTLNGQNSNEHLNEPITTLSDTHNFGYIDEENGSVHHQFKLFNQSTEPLVITRVSVDCGCTTPKWSDEAIMPNQETEIDVAFNPMGRPGAFVKKIRIYYNLSQSPYILTIKGTVTTLGVNSQAHLYSQKIGPIEISNKILAFPITAIGSSSNTIRLVLNNSSDEVVDIKIEGQLNGFEINKSIFSLGPHEPEEIYLTTNLQSDDQAGLKHSTMKISVQNASGMSDNGLILIELPAAPDFNSMDMNRRPKPKFKTYFNLGDIANLSTPVYNGFIEMSNEGQSDLIIYSIHSESPLVLIDKDNNKVIKPGQTEQIKYIIDTDNLKVSGSKLSANISLIVNDPTAPYRKVKLVINNQ